MVQRPEQLSLTAVQISPRSFKRQLATVLDALAESQHRATILAKLPQGKQWLEDLRKYRQAIAPTPDIYLFCRRSPDYLDWLTVVPIPQAHPMQGEYSLVVISEAIALMIQGHREIITVPTNGNVSSADGEPSEGIENSSRVRFSITFQKSAIAETLSEFRRVIQTSLLEHTHQPALKALATHWEARLHLPDQSDPAILDAILQKQAENQEKLQQKAQGYRRQAQTASSLSTQNEALINTLRLKDDFLSTVGQELRTPLSTIKTALPLLASPNLKPPQRQRYLDMISRECDRQSRLINGVLNLLQVERSLATATPDPIRLFDVVPGVVSTYQPLAQEKGIRLAYTVPNTLPLVCCPESWVRQIVIHLLNNSIRYTEAGGEVWVTANEEGEDTLALNVKDTGVGIPASELPHIFEHFYRGRQLNQEEEGAGLGLTIVQQLLLYCNGQISVESQPSMGTHFTVRLPLYHGD